MKRLRPEQWDMVVDLLSIVPAAVRRTGRNIRLRLGEDRVYDAALDTLIYAVRLRYPDREAAQAYYWGYVFAEVVKRERRLSPWARATPNVDWRQPDVPEPEADPGDEKAMRHLLGTLTDAEAEIVVGRFAQDQTCRQVADRLGVGASAVHNRTAVVLAKLRQAAGNQKEEVRRVDS